MNVGAKTRHSSEAIKTSLCSPILQSSGAKKTSLCSPVSPSLSSITLPDLFFTTLPSLAQSEFQYLNHFGVDGVKC